VEQHTTTIIARTRGVYGVGTVERRGDQFVARSPRQADGRRAVLGRFRFDAADPKAEARARAAADAIVRDVAELAARAGLAEGAAMSVRAYGPRFLDARELEGRGKAMKGRDAPSTIRTDRSRWRLHIDSADFAQKPAQAVDPREIREWMATLGKKKTQDVRAKDAKREGKSYLRKPRPLSPQTIKHCFNLLSKAFDRMKLDGFVTHNPCDEVEPPTVVEGVFAYLDPSEQDKIERCDWRPKRAGDDARLYGEADKLRAFFAWGTGMRQFDQWCMKLADLYDVESADPYVYFYCHKKRGMVKVPLFGIALRAVRRQLEILPAYCPKNDKGLLWPLPSGARRQRSKNYGWHKLCAAAGVSKHVTWHELRDTCASSLLNGWWGRRWRLEEVSEMLSHSGIEVTERYAHLDPGTLGQAARETGSLGGAIGHGIGHGSKGRKSKSSTNTGRATGDSNARPSASEPYSLASNSPQLDPARGQFVANLAQTVIAAGSSGAPSFARLALELAEAVLGEAAAPSAKVIPIRRRAK